MPNSEKSKKCHKDIVKLLINKGASVNANVDGCTALFEGRFYTSSFFHFRFYFFLIIKLQNVAKMT